MDTTLQAISFIAMVFSLLGNWDINEKKKRGFIIWTIGNLIWIGTDIVTHNWSQLIMFSIYILFNIEGYIKWRRVESNAKG